MPLVLCCHMLHFLYLQQCWQVALLGSDQYTKGLKKNAPWPANPSLRAKGSDLTALLSMSLSKVAGGCCQTG